MCQKLDQQVDIGQCHIHLRTENTCFITCSHEINPNSNLYRLVKLSKKSFTNYNNVSDVNNRLGKVSDLGCCICSCKNIMLKYQIRELTSYQIVMRHLVWNELKSLHCSLQCAFLWSCSDFSRSTPETPFVIQCCRRFQGQRLLSTPEILEQPQQQWRHTVCISSKKL